MPSADEGKMADAGQETTVTDQQQDAEMAPEAAAPTGADQGGASAAPADAQPDSSTDSKQQVSTNHQQTGAANKRRVLCAASHVLHDRVPF